MWPRSVSRARPAGRRTSAATRSPLTAAVRLPRVCRERGPWRHAEFRRQVIVRVGREQGDRLPADAAPLMDALVMQCYPSAAGRSRRRRGVTMTRKLGMASRPRRFLKRGLAVVALAAAAGVVGAVPPLASADRVYHSQHLALAPLGNAPLRSGFVEN